jgi:hypothetical protein
MSCPVKEIGVLITSRFESARTAYDAAQERVDEAIAVMEADAPAAAARHAELAEQFRSAQRKVIAAKGRVTRARKTGDAAKLAAAEQHLTSAEADLARISDANLAEMQGIIRERLDKLGTVIGCIGEKQDAYGRFLDARQ